MIHSVSGLFEKAEEEGTVKSDKGTPCLAGLALLDRYALCMKVSCFNLSETFP